MKDGPEAIEAVWEIESIRLIASIARVTHDISIERELAQDALVTALQLCPKKASPKIPARGYSSWRALPNERRYAATGGPTCGSSHALQP